MERKPWQGNGPRRNFDRFDHYENDRGDRFNRFDREDRFGERQDRGERTNRFNQFERSDRRDFGARRYDDRGEGRYEGRGDRFDRGDRFNRYDRSGERRQSFGERRGYGPRQGQGQGRSREDFGVRSGPRARAYDERRYVERSDFAKNAVVRIDSDIADFFGSPEAVNKALRLLVDAARVVNFKRPEKASAEEAIEPETAAQIFASDDLGDDEEAEYGVEAAATAEETAQAGEEASADDASEAQEAPQPTEPVEK